MYVFKGGHKCKDWVVQWAKLLPSQQSRLQSHLHSFQVCEQILGRDPIGNMDLHQKGSPGLSK